MVAIANSVEWLVRKVYCYGPSVQLFVRNEYNLL